MKIIVLDGSVVNPGDLSWNELGALGELKVYDRTPANQVALRIGDADAAYTNKTPITKETMDACPNLKFISVLSTGYNVVDYEYARQKGIPVSNIPTYGTAAVGQFAIALLLEICHHIGHHDKAVHEGRWERKDNWCFWDYPMIELAAKTIGIIGLGRIGQTTGKIAGSLGMKVIALDEYPNDSGKEIAEYVDLDTLLKTADVISLHCPLFPSTAGIIRKENIAKMKDGVIILNNSRGSLVVEQDLADALNSGKVYAAGLDVASTEPIKGDNPLLKAQNCIITPHISWATKESRLRLMDIAVKNMQAFVDGVLINVVN